MKKSTNHRNSPAYSRRIPEPDSRFLLSHISVPDHRGRRTGHLPDDISYPRNCLCTLRRTNPDIHLPSGRSQCEERPEYLPGRAGDITDHLGNPYDCDTFFRSLSGRTRSAGTAVRPASADNGAVYSVFRYPCLYLRLLLWHEKNCCAGSVPAPGTIYSHRRSFTDRQCRCYKWKNDFCFTGCLGHADR